jgi:hypothetical protein
MDQLLLLSLTKSLLWQMSQSLLGRESEVMGRDEKSLFLSLSLPSPHIIPPHSHFLLNLMHHNISEECLGMCICCMFLVQFPVKHKKEC